MSVLKFQIENLYSISKLVTQFLLKNRKKLYINRYFKIIILLGFNIQLYFK